ncbi:MAG: hypothetical protein KDE27_16040 [Planctomycetes bacterium]|nr:hypothetical protein [Planctomycetota bacterium]
MDAFELLKTGDLASAIEATIGAVRAHPTDVGHRYNLAAMLVMQGDLDRADTHLDAISTLDPKLAVAAAVFRACLEAEEERRRVFAGTAKPGMPPAGAEAIERRVELHERLRAGDDANAAMAACAGDAAGQGELDGATFRSLADQDETLGGVLEVYASGRYLWLPLNGFRSLDFAAPKGLLDLVWASCEFEDRDGRRATVHVPVLYADTAAHADPLVRVGRVTAWTDCDGIAFRGHGPRLLQVDDREVPLLDVRSIRFE